MKKGVNIGLSIILLLVISVSAIIVTDSSESDFNQGTYSNTFYNSSGFIQLNGSTEGTFTSRIIDAGNNAVWNNFSWVEGAPYEEDLPHQQKIATNPQLFHQAATSNKAAYEKIRQ